MSAARTIDVNADIGESYGRWELGDDESLLDHVSSASVAAGFHAGDPATIRRTVEAAVERGVAIGAHVGLPDRLGFGRRAMDVEPDELRDYVVYQAGAVAAFARAAGSVLSYVKPHGALYYMAGSDPEVAAAIAAGVAGLDPRVPLLLPTEHADAVAAQGVELIAEGFPDLEYGPDGRSMLEPRKRAAEPRVVAERAVRLALEGRVVATDGSEHEVDVRTLCIHGDAPNAVSVALAVKQALEEAGVALAPLRPETSPSASNGPPTIPSQLKEER